MSDERKTQPDRPDQGQAHPLEEKWAEEGRLLTGRHDLGHDQPPAARPEMVKNWPVLDLGAQPDVKPENWRLRVGGWSKIRWC